MRQLMTQDQFRLVRLQHSLRQIDRPGLYAAGEVTWISGAYSAAVTFGRIAGASVAEDIL